MFFHVFIKFCDILGIYRLSLRVVKLRNVLCANSSLIQLLKRLLVSSVVETTTATIGATQSLSIVMQLLLTSRLLKLWVLVLYESIVVIIWSKF